MTAEWKAGPTVFMKNGKRFFSTDGFWHRERLTQLGYWWPNKFHSIYWMA